MVDNAIVHVNRFTTAILALGSGLYIAPDYFWNPISGVVPRKFLREEPFQDLTDYHFDAFTVFCMRSSGAVMFGILLLHLFFFSPSYLAPFLRFKLVLLSAQVALFAQVLVANPSDIYHKDFLIVDLVGKGLSALAIAGVLLKGRLPNEAKATTSFGKRQSKVLAIIGLMFSIPLIVLRIFYPRVMMPGGAMACHVVPEQGGPDVSETIREIQVLASQYSGTNLFACAFYCWEIGRRSLRIDIPHLLIPLLYELILLNGVFDRTGSSIKSVIAIILALNVFCVAVWWWIINTKEPIVPPSKEMEATVPDLTPEKKEQ